jgi:uncharacterized protein (DUF924 family)
MASSDNIATPAVVLAFWREAGPNRWFTRDEAFDASVRENFLATYQAAAAGELSDWEATAEGALALVIVLDQFPRNMFRGHPRSFATDPQARAAAKNAVARGFDLALPPVQRPFIYMPFQHSENLADQEESLRLFHRLAAEVPAMAGYIEYAEHHLEVVRRFGRFPHRNAVLGRASTAAELEFLRRPT